MKKKSEKFRKISETLENLCYKMPVPERRFFTVYLARLDTDNNAKGIIEFSVIEFRKIMEIEPYSDDMDSLRQAIDSILNKITEIPESDGNSKIVHLLCDCRILRNNNQIFLSFTPHRDILPFLMDFKEKLFSNHIWNCFALESESQILMYKLLRYYIDLGILEINIEDLKKRLGIKPEDCRRSDRFRRKILDSYQNTMAENTDICYTYRAGKSDKKGKLISVIFYIRENENFPDPLNLRDFI